MQKFKTDFLSAMSPGKIVAAVVIIAIIAPFIIGFARKAKPIAAVLDKAQGA